MLSTCNNVKVLTDDIKLPEYVLRTLTTGPKTQALQGFNKNDILIDVDTLLEFLEPKITGENIVH